MYSVPLTNNHRGRDIRSFHCDITALLIRSPGNYGKYHPPVLGPVSGINLGANAPRLIPDTVPRLEGDISLIAVMLDNVMSDLRNCKINLANRLQMAGGITLTSA